MHVSRTRAVDQDQMALPRCLAFGNFSSGYGIKFLRHACTLHQGHNRACSHVRHCTHAALCACSCAYRARSGPAAQPQPAGPTGTWAAAAKGRTAQVMTMRAMGMAAMARGAWAAARGAVAAAAVAEAGGALLLGELGRHCFWGGGGARCMQTLGSRIARDCCHSPSIGDRVRTISGPLLTSPATGQTNQPTHRMPLGSPMSVLEEGDEEAGDEGGKKAGAGGRQRGQRAAAKPKRSYRGGFGARRFPNLFMWPACMTDRPDQMVGLALLW